MNPAIGADPRGFRRRPRHGYTAFRGLPCCTCLADWLPWYERALLEAGEIRQSIDIYQLRGLVAASGGTHSGGGAYDVVQRSDRAVLIARQLGAAAWRRAPWNPEHQHGVLKGCDTNGAAFYQVAALNAGFDGLGAGGRAARDPGPRSGVHWPIRDWDDAIRAYPWQQPKPQPSTPRLEEDPVPAINERRSAVRKEIPKKSPYEGFTICPIGDTEEFFADAAKVFPPQPAPVVFNSTVRLRLRRADDRQEPWAAAVRFVMWQPDVKKWWRYQWSDHSAASSEMAVETTLPAWMHTAKCDLYVEVAPTTDCVALATSAQTHLWKK